MFRAASNLSLNVTMLSFNARSMASMAFSSSPGASGSVSAVGICGAAGATAGTPATGAFAPVASLPVFDDESSPAFSGTIGVPAVSALPCVFPDSSSVSCGIDSAPISFSSSIPAYEMTPSM